MIPKDIVASFHGSSAPAILIGQFDVLSPISQLCRPGSCTGAALGRASFFHRPSLAARNEKVEKVEKGEKENFSCLKNKELQAENR